MSAEPARRTLVVANRTAATPLLLDEIRRRAGEQPTAFVLLCPSVSRKARDWSLDEALKAIRKAAAGPTGQRETHVEGLQGAEDPFQAVKDALAGGAFDDVLISTLPKRTSEWLRRDLPRRVEALGVPVSVITQPGAKRVAASEAMLWNKKGTAARSDQEDV
jgi:hypothetical protein